jgi:hypothetical protein
MIQACSHNRAVKEMARLAQHDGPQPNLTVADSLDHRIGCPPLSADRSKVRQQKFAADSPLEGRVSSELVSEIPQIPC